MRGEGIEHSSTPTRCRNCGSAFTGDYCPSCGQRDIDLRRDWRGLVEEYASSMFNFDGKVPRGIFQLLFRPGSATRDYLDGKRARQMPPVRLYLFASLVFFVWIAALQHGELGAYHFETPPPAESSFVPAAESEFAKSFTENFSDPESFRTAFNTWLPRVFLFGAPLLAGVTRLLFRKRELVYLEHVILSLHLQTFALLWLLLLGLLGAALGFFWPVAGTMAWKILLCWLPLYPVLALRRVFELGWLKSVGAALALEAIYAAMLVAGVVLVVYLTLWMA